MQIPCVALAIVLAVAAGMGELLSRLRLRLLYFEIAGIVAVITLVFLSRGVYRR